VGHSECLDSVAFSDIFSVNTNSLTSLPVGIGNLTSLVYLYGRIYRDHHFCLALSDCLRYLVNVNQLTSLPAELGLCTSLTVLNVGQNAITTLPPEIGQLTGLAELYRKTE
jgi:Leucine-rich repeat (LRR) protein